MTVSPNLPPVQTGDVAQQVDALRAMRREAAIWRYAAFAITALMVIYSIFTLRASALGLINPGPTQTEFTSQLSAGLQKDVVPNIQQIATQTLTEMRPQVEKSFLKLNDRSPELAQASMNELTTLHTNLQTKSEKVFNDTFSQELTKREGKIKEMFPDATEDKIKALVENMTTVGEKHIPAVADQLMSKHLEAMDGIATNIQTIKAQEKVSPSENVANWEMALTVMDLVRDDLRELALAEAKTGTTPAASPKPSASFSPVKAGATVAAKGAKK